MSSAQFTGQVQVVSFLFPYCTTYCPVIARVLGQLQRQLATDHLTGRVRLVSFDVDPTGSGPAQMRQFMQDMGGDPASGSWEFLTGSTATVRQVVTDGFHIYYQRISLASEAAENAGNRDAPQPDVPNPVASQNPVNYDIQHNDDLEIVDPTGRIRVINDDGSTATTAHLLSQIEGCLGPAPVTSRP